MSRRSARHHGRGSGIAEGEAEALERLDRLASGAEWPLSRTRSACAVRRRRTPRTSRGVVARFPPGGRSRRAGRGPRRASRRRSTAGCTRRPSRSRSSTWRCRRAGPSTSLLWSWRLQSQPPHVLPPPPGLSGAHDRNRLLISTLRINLLRIRCPEFDGLSLARRLTLPRCSASRLPRRAGSGTSPSRSSPSAPESRPSPPARSSGAIRPSTGHRVEVAWLVGVPLFGVDDRTSMAGLVRQGRDRLALLPTVVRPPADEAPDGDF